MRIESRGIDPLLVAPPERHLAAHLAPDHSRVGDTAGERLAEEVGDDLLHLPALQRVGEVPRLLGAQVDPGRGDRAEQLRPLRVGALQLSEELASRGEGRVVRGRTEAVDGLRGERARLALAGHLLRRLAHLERERREDGSLRALSDLRDARQHAGRRREQDVGEQRRPQQGAQRRAWNRTRFATAPEAAPPNGRGSSRRTISRSDPPHRPG